MKRLLVLGGLVIAGALSLAAQQRPGDPIAAMLAQKPSLAALSVEKVRDNLFVMRGAGGNIAVFVTANGVVMVDSGLPGWGQTILDKLKTITDKPVTTLINTHAHFDHASGNVEFPANVDIIAHANAKQEMQNVHQVYGLAASPANNIYTAHGGRGLPKRTFTKDLAIGTGNDRIELRYFGRAHTGGDAFVIFPALRVAHVGDVFPNKGLPIMDRNNGGAGIAYPQTVAAVAAGLRARNNDTHNNGQTPAHTTLADMQQYAAFTLAFVDAVRAAKKAGQTVAQFAAAWKVPAAFPGYSAGLGDSVKNDAQVVWDELK
jgi:glyoxylase-like metal-dependent hydrolase (beta-lactamase superfamily II)